MVKGTRTPESTAESTPAQQPAVTPFANDGFDKNAVLGELRQLSKDVASLATKVDRLIDDVKAQDAKFGDVKGQIHAVDKTVHGFKMAVFVGGPLLAAALTAFWYLEGPHVMAALNAPLPDLAAPATP